MVQWMEMPTLHVVSDEWVRLLPDWQPTTTNTTEMVYTDCVCVCVEICVGVSEKEIL